MKHKENKINTLFHFTVEGTGEFPFVMLQKQRCWPKTESPDAVAIAPHSRSETYRQKRQVTLTSLSEPNVARWASWGWQVVSTDVQRLG